MDTGLPPLHAESLSGGLSVLLPLRGCRDRHTTADCLQSAPTSLTWCILKKPLVLGGVRGWVCLVSSTVGRSGDDSNIHPAAVCLEPLGVVWIKKYRPGGQETSVRVCCLAAHLLCDLGQVTALLWACVLCLGGVWSETWRGFLARTVGVSADSLCGVSVIPRTVSG